MLGMGEDFELQTGVLAGFMNGGQIGLWAPKHNIVNNSGGRLWDGLIEPRIRCTVLISPRISHGMVPRLAFAITTMNV